jgi:hypothetical protein
MLDPPFDNNANSHPHVTPGAVFLRDEIARVNEDVNAHAVGVAGLMIADGPNNKGIAPNAILHASAYRTTGFGWPAYEHALLSMQKVATKRGKGVRTRFH